MEVSTGSDVISAGFALNARTLDDGEAVTSVTVDITALGPIAAESLTTGTFSVHATGTSPVPIPPDDTTCRQYDLDREVTAARFDPDGNIVLELAYGVDELGTGSLAFLDGKGTVRLDLAYTITQNAPLVGVNGGPVTIARFEQGPLVDTEVDAFSYLKSAAGMKYRLFTPETGVGSRPLVVWLHGGAEGALAEDGYYDNETQLRGSRGALGFTTPLAQRIFAGAYVLAPQSTANWMDDGPRFAAQVYDIIQDVVGNLPIDGRRIYVAGSSSGGYLTLEMVSRYPDLFAAAVPSSCVVQADPRDRGPGGAPRLISDDVLATITTATWLVVSSNDDIIDPRVNSLHAHELIPGSRISVYDHVSWNDVEFSGHWSWIYLTHNDPALDGTHVWQWMADQQRRSGRAAPPASSVNRPR